MASCMSQVPSGVVTRTAPKAVASYTGLARISLPSAKVAKKSQWVSNGIKTRQMMVWQPVNNKYFETLSYLPPLTDDEIAKQIDYMIGSGWIPCLEFSDPEHAYITSVSNIRFGAVSSNYIDNRYWTMFKLPMYGCSDSGQVLKEVKDCADKFPNAYIRVVGFDSVRQVQCAMVLVHRPPKEEAYRAIDDRSI